MQEASHIYEIIIGVVALVINIIGYSVTITVVVTRLGGRIDIVKHSQDNHARNSVNEFAAVKLEIQAIKSAIKQIDATERLIAVLTERVQIQGQLLSGIQQSMAVLQRDMQQIHTVRDYGDRQT